MSPPEIFTRTTTTMPHENTLDAARAALVVLDMQESFRAALAPEIEPVEKTAFSSCGAREFVARLEQTGARQILVCGIEAHICVNQTTHDLLARGYQVHLLTDCITARAAHNKQTAFSKMQQS